MASTPSKTAEVEMMIPPRPIKMPQITTKPSFPSNPKEITKIPKPGIKLESGTGIKMNEEKIKIKIPTIFSAIGEIIKDKRGLKNLSILRI